VLSWMIDTTKTSDKVNKRGDRFLDSELKVYDTRGTLTDQIGSEWVPALQLTGKRSSTVQAVARSTPPRAAGISSYQPLTSCIAPVCGHLFVRPCLDVLGSIVHASCPGGQGTYLQTIYLDVYH
jgi:hypothetical protein